MRYSILIFSILVLANCIAAQIAPTLTVPKGHKSTVRNCYFTPNDKYLVSTDYDHVLCIWDGDDGRQLFTLQDSSASFTKIEINNASTLIAALTDSGKLYMIHLNTLKAELLQDQVRDFSMLKKDGILFFISETGGIYKYNPGSVGVKRIKSSAVTNPLKILALSGNEACVQDLSKEIFIINENSNKSSPLPLPPSEGLMLHDIHAETGYLLCSEFKKYGDGITYYNIDAKSRTIKSKISIEGIYRSPSCAYTSNNSVFLATGISEDPEGIFRTNPPTLYSFKTVKEIAKTGEQFVYNVAELNLNTSRKGFVAKKETDYGLEFYQRIDLATASESMIFRKEASTDEKLEFACANKSRKIAVFYNIFLLPNIYPDGVVGPEGLTGLKKYTDLKINFFPDISAQDKKAVRKIGFLAAGEIALNDSVIFSSDPFNSLDGLFEGKLYYLKNARITDSVKFRYQYLSNPLQGSTRVFWVKANRFYAMDIATGNITDSLDFAPHIVIRTLRQAGNTVLIEREDSLANPRSSILVYNLAKRQITDTTFIEGMSMLKPYEELNYTHRTEGYYFEGIFVRDYDYEQNSLFEYPYNVGRVDTVAVFDSAGEISGYRAVQEAPYLRVTTEPGTAASKEWDIADKIENLQVGQVRYWGDSCYIILSTQNRLLLYSIALDSVLRKIDCNTDRHSRLFLLRNKHMLISNENRNSSYVIDPAKGIIIAHIKGFLNPSIHQTGRFLVLEDAAFGNYNIYRENDYGFVSSITPFSKTDFVVNTPSGLFDGTDNAIQSLYFLINDVTDKVKPWKTIDLNQLKAKYYIPGLWDKLISGDSTDLPDVESIKNISLAPEIITDSSYSFTKPYKITLLDKGGGIGAVRVVINGKEVIADARKNNKVIGKQLSLLIDLSSYKEYFGAENNSIQVFSSNADSSLTSRGIITSSKKTTQQASPRLFIISIGTSDYKGTEIDLQYSAKDAADMAAGLKAGAKELFSADSTFTFLLTSNTSDSSLLPSKKNIEKIFSLISQKAASKDIIVLYLSGHGINAGGDFCYLTRDAYTANASAYVFKEMLQAVTISSKELTEYLKKIKALKQLFIIDACASGKVVENLVAHRDIPYSTLKALDRLKDRTGTHIITGCAADAVSYEASRYGQGLLTYSLLEGMKGASLRENKFLDVMQWFQYARERVPQLADGLGGIQTPQVYSPSGNQSFDIALLNEEIKKQVPLASEKPVFIKSIFQDEEKFADQLQLGRLLDNTLSEKSSGGRKSNFIFFPVDEFPGAYQVLGRYKISGKEIIASVKVYKAPGIDSISSFTITASEASLLVSAILEKITELK